MRPATLFVAALPAVLLGGCVTTEQAVNTAVDTVRLANDKALESGELLTCSGALSSIRRRYGDDPQKLRALLTLCGWSSHNIDVLIGDGLWRN